MTPQELHTFVQAAPLGMLFVLNCVTFCHPANPNPVESRHMYVGPQHYLIKQFVETLLENDDEL